MQGQIFFANGHWALTNEDNKSSNIFFFRRQRLKSKKHRFFITLGYLLSVIAAINLFYLFKG